MAAATVVPVGALLRSTNVVKWKHDRHRLPLVKKGGQLAAAKVATVGVLKTPGDNVLLEPVTFQPPAFIPPYPVETNPLFLSGDFNKNFAKKAKQWLVQLNVDTHASPKQYKMLLDMNILALAAVIYSDAGEWGFEWVTKFMFMLWIWDDTLAATDMGKSQEAVLRDLLDAHLVMMWSFPDDPVLRTRLEPLLTHLDIQERDEKMGYIDSVLAEARNKPGTVYTKQISTICNVYLDLWREAITRTSPEFCLRFGHSVQEWLLGCFEETEILKKNAVPASIDNYIELRKRSSGMAGAVAVTDLVYGLSTPNSWFDSPEMQRVIEAMADIGGWHNDIWSFKREVFREKDPFNLVLAISVHNRVSYTKAAEIAIQMLYDRIADFEKAVSDLESVTPPELRQTFDLYMLTCRRCVSGTEHWHSNCIRYQ